MLKKGGIVLIRTADVETDRDISPICVGDSFQLEPSYGYTFMAADYRLITANLLHLSHESYIHQGTIGNKDEETIADYPAQVTVREHLVRAHRYMTGCDDRIDRWQTALWTAPSINMTDVGARHVGAAREDTLVSRVLHLLTPETETSTHYFWIHNRNFRQEDAELTAGITDAHYRTFDEDKEMLELQQRELTATSSSVPQFALRVYDAPLRARRILTALVRQQGEGAKHLLTKDLALIPDPDALEPLLD